MVQPYAQVHTMNIYAYKIVQMDQVLGFTAFTVGLLDLCQSYQKKFTKVKSELGKLVANNCMPIQGNYLHRLIQIVYESTILKSGDLTFYKSITNKTFHSF